MKDKAAGGSPLMHKATKYEKIYKTRIEPVWV